MSGLVCGLGKSGSKNVDHGIAATIRKMKSKKRSRENVSPIGEMRFGTVCLTQKGTSYERAECHDFSRRMSFAKSHQYGTI